MDRCGRELGANRAAPTAEVGLAGHLRLSHRALQVSLPSSIGSLRLHRLYGFGRFGCPAALGGGALRGASELFKRAQKLLLGVGSVLDLPLVGLPLANGFPRLLLLLPGLLAGGPSARGRPAGFFPSSLLRVVSRFLLSLAGLASLGAFLGRRD